MLTDFLTVIPQTPSLVLVTYRPEYRGRMTQLPGAQTIALAPLSDSETAALVSQLLGPDPSVGALARQSPLGPLEIRFSPRRSCASWPIAMCCTATPAHTCRRRSHRGERACHAAGHDRRAHRPARPKTKRTLGTAAVVGSRFDLDLLTVLGSSQSFSLGDRPAHRSGQVHRATRIRLSHPLIRAVAYEAQLKSDRAELHRRVAAAIESRDPARSTRTLR